MPKRNVPKPTRKADLSSDIKELSRGGALLEKRPHNGIGKIPFNNEFPILPLTPQRESADVLSCSSGMQANWATWNPE